MENIIYKNLEAEVSEKFRENLTEEQYRELLPIFLDYIKKTYHVIFEIITDENDPFYQSSIRNECLKICKLDIDGKKALLIKDNNINELSILSLEIFDKAEQKLLSRSNTISEEDAFKIKEQANKLYSDVKEYNKEQAQSILSELILDLNYCSSDTNAISFRLSNLAKDIENIKDINTK